MNRRIGFSTTGRRCAFVEAGVKRVVYTSFLRAAPDAVFTLARDHFHTEQYFESAGLRFSALRNSLYQDVLPDLVDGGVIRGPAGTGRFAPVSRADIADVAVALLLDDDQPTARFDVTGPELLTMAEVADLLGEAAGSPVPCVNETLAEAYASRAHSDVPTFEIEGWVTSYHAIVVGELAIASGAVESITPSAPASRPEPGRALPAGPDNWIGGNTEGNGGRSRHAYLAPTAQIDEAIDVMGRATVEAVLQMSAEHVTGPKTQGRGRDREGYRHGVQEGRVALNRQTVRITRQSNCLERRRADGRIHRHSTVRFPNVGVTDVPISDGRRAHAQKTGRDGP